MNKRQKKSFRPKRVVSSTKKLPDLVVAPLVEADRRLKSIQVASEVATWTWDILNDRVVADRNFARLFGVSPEVAAGGAIEKYIECIHPDD
jgi:PAS domain-containing protein